MEKVQVKNMKEVYIETQEHKRIQKKDKDRVQTAETACKIIYLPILIVDETIPSL